MFNRLVRYGTLSNGGRQSEGRAADPMLRLWIAKGTQNIISKHQ